jgi:hypothetical protein
MEAACVRGRKERCPGVMGQAAEGKVVRVREWWEAHAKILVVGAPEGIYAYETGYVEVLALLMREDSIYGDLIGRTSFSMTISPTA